LAAHDGQVSNCRNHGKCGARVTFGIEMRFNVVIGGEEIAKTGKGLLTFPWEILHREGVLAAASVLIAPFLLLLVMIRIFPPWEDSPAAESH